MIVTGLAPGDAGRTRFAHDPERSACNRDPTFAPSPASSAMRFAVAQLGARQSYAVPLVLARAGLLERFYTDVAGNAAWLRHLQAPFSRLPPRHALARLANRRVPPEILDRTTTFPARSLAHALTSGLRRTPAGRFHAHLRHSGRLGKAMAGSGLGEATHLYSMLGECGPLLEEAHRRGLVVVSDVYARPSMHQVIREERRRFPGWEPNDDIDPNIHRASAGIPDYMNQYSSFYICSASHVRLDLHKHIGVPFQRIAVVPLGISDEWLHSPAEPRRGRILYAGTATLFKGIHYFAYAAQIARGRAPELEFRVAGAAPASVRERRPCRHVTFLGRVPRATMAREFATADVCVLPSLGDTFGIVQLEAMACGVPVVATRSCGEVVRDGIDGRIVPERDPEALALAIEEIALDRGKRDRMSAAARERAREFTWERYGERLVAALRGFGEPIPREEA